MIDEFRVPRCTIPASNAVISVRAAAVLAVASMLVGSVLIALTAVRTSITVDEPYFYSYGHRILFESSFARHDPIDDSKLPVSAVSALPEWIADAVNFDSARLGESLRRWFVPPEAEYIAAHLPIYAGRLVAIGFYFALCLLVFAWAYEAYGSAAATAATVLVGFLPSILGHAALVTVDVPASVAVFGAAYALRNCFVRPRLVPVIIAGCALGAAQLVKYTAVELFPMALVFLIINVVATPQPMRWTVLRRGIGALAGACVIALLVINAGFAFQGCGVRLDDLPCRSAVCQHLQSALGPLRLPFPYEYLNGLDMVIYHDHSRTMGSEVYLLGERTRAGFSAYYLIAMILKTPLAFLALLAFRPWRTHRRLNDVMLLLPAAWLFVHLSFLFRLQIGIRFLLPAFPFLAVAAAANWSPAVSPWRRRIASLVLALYVIGSAIQCPRYLAYFNVLVPDRTAAYRYLADSNLDWGQDLFALWAWEREHAGERYALEPYYPTEGLVIVRANDFLGISDPRAYRWLRRRGIPLGTIGDSYLMFQVPPRYSARVATRNAARRPSAN